MIYLKVFLTFMKIGAFTFGGGYAMLAVIQEEVLRNGWLSSEELTNFIAISESTPGPFAVNVSTYVGYQTGGILGAICATLGVVLPSFILVFLIAGIFDKFRENRIVRGCMSGLTPAIVGLIGVAVITTAQSAFPSILQGGAFNGSILIGILMFGILLFWLRKGGHPIWIIGGSAVFGILVHAL